MPTPYSTDLIKHINKAATEIYNGNDNKFKKEFNSLSKYKENFKEKFACAFTDVLIEELSLLGNITHTLIIMNSKSSTFISDMLEIGNFMQKYRDENGNSINI